MPDLGSTFMGIYFKTPFILASGQASLRAGHIKHAAEAMVENHWAGFVSKSIISEVHSQQRPYLWGSADYRFLSMQNMGPTMDKYSNSLLNLLKEDFRISKQAGLICIASIIGYSMDEWIEMAKNMEDVGADALELNLSCPVRDKTVKGSMGGCTVLEDTQKTYEIVNAVSKNCSIPVMVKLSFHVRDIAEVAKVCKEAGADAVSAINTIRGIVGIDIDTGNLLSSDASGNGYITGLSGPVIRPFALKCVIEIGLTSDVPVCAIGGIENWKNIVELLMAGAGLTQTCTSVMWHGFGLGKKLRDGLTQFMKDKGYTCIQDFRGISLGRVVVDSIDHPWVKARIDRARCNLCQKCVIACRDAAFSALHVIGSGKSAYIEVDDSACEGCGLCKVVCKKEAISYVSQ